MRGFLKTLFWIGLFAAGCARDASVQTAEVAVQRAAYNQPQITVRHAPQGNADYLLVYQQGYTQAQDRFLQMDLTRRYTQGRLSEVFGEKAVPQDQQSIGVGLRRSIERKDAHLREQHPETYELLKGFAEGVNQFLSEMPTMAPDTLKNYRQITGDPNYVPDPWVTADSIAVAQGISFYLSSNLQEKLLLGQISLALGGPTDPTTSKLAKGLDFRPVYNSFILDADPGQNRWRKIRSGAVAAAPELPAMGDIALGFPAVGCLQLPYPFPECGRRASFGSNNWVVSKEFAGGDTTYLANDPHLRLAFPMTFYEGAYDSTPAGGTIRVRGYGLVGLPGVLIGHNDYIAWGMTNVGADVDDIYLEVLKHQDPNQVWKKKVEGRDSWEPLDVETVVLKVRDGSGHLQDRPMQLRWASGHGPLFSDHIPELRQKLDEYSGKLPIPVKLAGSYRWVGHGDSSEVAAMLGVNRARNYAEFREAMQEFKAGAQNIVFAGTQGDIAYYAHGDYPVRNYASDAQAPFAPIIPYVRAMLVAIFPGFAKPAEWEGYRTESPELVNPSSGRIITANNDPYGHSEGRSLSGYQDYFGYSFSTGVRSERITRLLDAAKGKVDLATIQAIQTDHVDLLHAALVEAIRPVRSRLNLSPGGAAVADAILNWDFDMKRTETTPLIADTWYTELSSVYLGLSAPNVPLLLREGLQRTQILSRTIYHHIRDGLASQSPQAQSASLKLVELSFEETAKHLDREGLNGVTWGTVHKLQFNNMLAGILPSLVSLPIARDGSWETVDVAGGDYGPNFRLIMMVKDGKPIEAVTSVPGGNYNMFQKDGIHSELLRWRDGEYRELVPFLN